MTQANPQQQVVDRVATRRGDNGQIDENLRRLDESLQKRLQTIEQLIPATAGGLGAEQFHRVLFVTVSKAVRDVSQWRQVITTTKGRTSILFAAMEAASLGLIVDGVLGHAYLVPRRDKNVWCAQFQIGYAGLNELAYRSGEVKFIEARSVREGDEFNWREGHDAFLHYKRPLDADPYAPLQGAYAMAHLASGLKVFKVMTKAEVEARRNMSVAYRHDPKTSIWTIHPDMMWAKTPNRDLCKTTPNTPQLNLVAKADELREMGKEARITNANLPQLSELANGNDLGEGEAEKVDG